MYFDTVELSPFVHHSSTRHPGLIDKEDSALQILQTSIEFWVTRLCLGHMVYVRLLFRAGHDYDSLIIFLIAGLIDIGDFLLAQPTVNGDLRA